VIKTEKNKGIGLIRGLGKLILKRILELSVKEKGE